MANGAGWKGPNGLYSCTCFVYVSMLLLSMGDKNAGETQRVRQHLWSKGNGPHFGPCLCIIQHFFCLQESGLKVNHPASFAVCLNGAKGLIDAKVHSPSGALEECCVTEIDQDKYAVRFIPRENGVYLIDVKFNGSHIPGSPFKIRVGEPGQTGDPGMVSASGPGLEGGVTGVQTDFVLNTSKAGPGALSVSIDGPSKVKMDCLECAEGYLVSYTPLAPGYYLICPSTLAPSVLLISGMECNSTPGNHVRGVSWSATSELKHQLYSVVYLLKEKGSYTLVVKWGDEHIPGSPFHISVP
ncbi:filamin-A-like [Leucoraja erinacea]|uniref:filamin-A-like n=1 Tax=Leucoraja erinaceus TaxID=7782 RepID=UPI002457B15F|nr:filamin-A-like [Leucoraja erinacea]